MVSSAELLTFVGLPLLLGVAVATGLRICRFEVAIAAGCWVAVVLTYLLRFALDEASASEQSLFASGGMNEHLLAAGRTILFPTTAIQWMPWCVTVLFLFAGPLTAFKTRIGADLKAEQGSNREYESLFTYALALLVFAVAMTRMLWTSVYFTDDYSLLPKFGFVAVPACVLGIGSFGFATSLPIHMRVSKQIVILLLAACSCGILATSGTLKYAMLGASGIVAACIPLALTRRTETSSPGEGMILSAAIGLPLVLGHFFAEVSNVSILLCGLSFACTLLLRYSKDVGWKSAAIALLLAGPALIALAISGYAFYMEVISEPVNPYGN